jgi:hypothetical protein
LAFWKKGVSNGFFRSHCVGVGLAHLGGTSRQSYANISAFPLSSHALPFILTKSYTV